MLGLRLWVVTLIFGMTLAACSAPFVSETDEDKAPGQPIGAAPGGDAQELGSGGTGAGTSAALGSAGFSTDVILSVGLVEIQDSAGKIKSACTAAAIASDLVLTSSLCATDCANTRARFLSNSKGAVSTSTSPSRRSSCNKVEVVENVQGRGFAILRIVLRDATDSLPAGNLVLKESSKAASAVPANLLHAWADGSELRVAATSTCTLRSSESAGASTTHDCIYSSAAGASAVGGIVFDASTKAALGLFDRVVGGAKLTTSSNAILAK